MFLKPETGILHYFSFFTVFPLLSQISSKVHSSSSLILYVSLSLPKFSSNTTSCTNYSKVIQTGDTFTYSYDVYLFNPYLSIMY